MIFNNTNNSQIPQKVKDRIPPKLWYKYFYEKPVELRWEGIQLPKINKFFPNITADQIIKEHDISIK